MSFMLLGLLFTSGTYQEKAEAVISLYDKNGDGEIFVNSIKKFLRGIFLISAFLVPALYSNEQYAETSE